MSPQQARRRKKRRAFYLKRAFVLGAMIFLLSVMAVFLFSCFGREPEPSNNQKGQDTGTTDPGVQESEAGTRAPFSDPALPEGWQRITMPESSLSEGTLVLVNQENAFDASIPKTVSVYENKNRSYMVKDIYLSVTPETVKALNNWMEAFAAQAGITDVNIVSGWRSFADQTAIYDNAVASKGQAHADAYIALPGHSEHHTGLAVDLDTYNVENGTSGGFDGDGEYAWAVQHAWEFTAASETGASRGVQLFTLYCCRGVRLSCNFSRNGSVVAFSVPAISFSDSGYHQLQRMGQPDRSGKPCFVSADQRLAHRRDGERLCCACPGFLHKSQKLLCRPVLSSAAVLLGQRIGHNVEASRVDGHLRNALCTG